MTEGSPKKPVDWGFLAKHWREVLRHVMVRPRSQEGRKPDLEAPPAPEPKPLAEPQPQPEPNPDPKLTPEPTQPALMPPPPRRKSKQLALSLFVLVALMTFFGWKAFAPAQIEVQDLLPIEVAAVLAPCLMVLAQWITVRRSKPLKRVGPFGYIWPASMTFFATVFAGLGVLRRSSPDWGYAIYTVILLLALVGVMDAIWNVSRRDPPDRA